MGQPVTRQTANVTGILLEDNKLSATDYEPPPCPCCGGRMKVIETFKDRSAGRNALSDPQFAAAILSDRYDKIANCRVTTHSAVRSGARVDQEAARLTSPESRPKAFT
jgi:hypothetical protein